MLHSWSTLFLICSVVIASAFAVPLGKTEHDAVLGRDPELNPDLFEGDILGISPDADMRNAIINQDRLWPNGIIYYEVVDPLSALEQETLDEAAAAYADNTCLRLQPRTNQANYVSIQKTGGGCSSFIGMIGGGQRMSLDPSCYRNGVPGTVIHEFMHAAGFYHEQSRTDRDDWVIINYDNIQPGKENNFNKYDETVITDLGTQYDYDSVLHYSGYGFAVDPSVPTIITIDPAYQETIGQRLGFSPNDITKLNILYNCP